MNENELESAVQHLGAENIALQTLVIGLIGALAEHGQKPLAKAAFDRADKALETAVIAMGENSPPWYSRRSLEILDQFRAMAAID